VPYHVECRRDDGGGCHTSAYIDCICPPEMAGVPGHLEGCPMGDPDAQITCPPGSDCCQVDHSGDPARRGHALLACPTDHADHPCPYPRNCGLWAPVVAHHARLRKLGDPAALSPPEDCPGGHHGYGVQDCGVCRPVVVTLMPGSVQLQRAAGG
jgi:hypothetical protein